MPPILSIKRRATTAAGSSSAGSERLLTGNASSATRTPTARVDSTATMTPAFDVGCRRKVPIHSFHRRSQMLASSYFM